MEYERIRIENDFDIRGSDRRSECSSMPNDHVGKLLSNS
jgi:hypothetical protein